MKIKKSIDFILGFYFKEWSNLRIYFSKVWEWPERNSFFQGKKANQSLYRFYINACRKILLGNKMIPGTTETIKRLSRKGQNHLDRLAKGAINSLRFRWSWNDAVFIPVTEFDDIPKGDIFNLSSAFHSHLLQKKCSERICSLKSEFQETFVRP